MSLYKCQVLCEYKTSRRGKVKQKKVSVLVEASDGSKAMDLAQAFAEKQMPIGPLYVGFMALNAASVRLPSFSE